MQYLNKSSIVESWEFIKSMVILHKSMILWIGNISIIKTISIYLEALNIRSIYFNSCEHHLWFTNQNNLSRKNIFPFLSLSSCRRYIKEALIISLGVYTEQFYLDSETHHSYFDIPIPFDSYFDSKTSLKA